MCGSRSSKSISLGCSGSSSWSPLLRPFLTGNPASDEAEADSPSGLASFEDRSPRTLPSAVGSFSCGGISLSVEISEAPREKRGGNTFFTRRPLRRFDSSLQGCCAAVSRSRWCPAARDLDLFKGALLSNFRSTMTGSARKESLTSRKTCWSSLSPHVTKQIVIVSRVIISSSTRRDNWTGKADRLNGRLISLN